ncbi:MAG: hypothetical protein RR702_02480 [Clostridia bacterium]
MEKQKIKNSFKIICMLFALVASSALFSTVNAYQINIRTKRLLSDDQFIRYRVYGSPHPNKISAAILGENHSQYNSLISASTIRYNGLNNWVNFTAAKQGAPKTNLYYNTDSVIFHAEPLSVYPSSPISADRGTYYYSKYTSNWTESINSSVNEAMNLDTVAGSCARPYKKGNADSIYKEAYPLYNAGSKNGYIRPFRATILCAGCNTGLHSLAGQTGNPNYGSLRSGHVSVTDYKISKTGYDDILSKFSNKAIREGNEYYIYMSDVNYTIGGYSAYPNDTVYAANNIGDFYNQTYAPNGANPRWAIDQRGVNNQGNAQPLSSLINAYDNKFYFPEPPTKEMVIKYYDVSGRDEANRMILDRTVTSKVVFNKQDNSMFNQGDMNKMALPAKTEVRTIPADQTGAFTVDSGDYEYVGYNQKLVNEENYTNKRDLTVINKSKNVVGSKGTSKIYVDVFLNSKKRVYVKHINTTEFYNTSTLTMQGINSNLINACSRVNKTPKQSILYQNGNIIGSIVANATAPSYDECYIIDWNKELEVTNAKTNQQQYIGYRSVAASKKQLAERYFTNLYNGGKLTFTLADRDKRVFTTQDSVNTFVDMYYVDEEPNKPTNPEDAKPVEINPNGLLCFQSDDEKFKTTTKNEFAPSKIEADKIPSSEDLKYGVLDIKEYIITRADVSSQNDIIRYDNGKNLVRIPYEFFNSKNLLMFTIADTMKLLDKGENIGSLLFAKDADKVLDIPLSEEYKKNVRETSLIDGSIKVEESSDNIPCSNSCNGICKNHYITVKITNMSLIYKGQNIIPNYEQSTGKILIRKERCKLVNGVAVIDDRKTEYLTPTNKKLTCDGYINKLSAAVKTANEKATVRDMNYLYQKNSQTILAEKFNGMRVPQATFGYNINNGIKHADVIDKVNNKTLKEKDKEVEPVIIHTPVIAEVVLHSDGSFVNHTGKPVEANNVIQKNVPFKIYPKTSGILHTTYPLVKEFDKYTKEYYVKFNFDIQYVEYYKDGATKPYTRNNTMQPTGTWIKIPKGEYISAQAVYDPNQVQNSVVDAIDSEYRMKVVANNAPAESTGYTKAALTLDIWGDSKMNINTRPHKEFHPQVLEQEAKYMAFVKNDASILGRIYDFRVTDVVDIDWKNVFRKDDAINHTGRFYYSGLFKWDMLSSQSNQMVPRKDSEVGSSPKRTLPVGPLKHTNTGYQAAPKLGYRFAFDVKTTGSIGDNVSKEVNIKPRFYYISKDGKVYNDKINLYYKNSTNKYIKVGSASDKYKITMRPADGLRHLAEYEKSYNKTNLSTNIISIGNISDIKLAQKTNMATNDNAFLQIWYGEYKLPNSTIAVDANQNDIGKPLTNGYIGIIFDISCKEMKNGAVVNEILYGANDLNAAGVNTTQWDYEGYLGSTAGSQFNGKLQLPSGNLNIDNALYEKIRGTVMLYETDERAATDFDVGAGK